MFNLNKCKPFTGFSVMKLYFLINMLNNRIIPFLNQRRIFPYFEKKKSDLRPHQLSPRASSQATSQTISVQVELLNTKANRSHWIRKLFLLAK